MSFRCQRHRLMLKLALIFLLPPPCSLHAQCQGFVKAQQQLQPLASFEACLQCFQCSAGLWFKGWTACLCCRETCHLFLKNTEHRSLLLRCRTVQSPGHLDIAATKIPRSFLAFSPNSMGLCCCAGEENQMQYIYNMLISMASALAWCFGYALAVSFQRSFVTLKPPSALSHLVALSDPETPAEIACPWLGRVVNTIGNGCHIWCSWLEAIQPGEPCHRLSEVLLLSNLLISKWRCQILARHWWVILFNHCRCFCNASQVLRIGEDTTHYLQVLTAELG